MASLPEYDFDPHYMEAEGCHIHYIDAGDKGSPVIVFLHGVPTWSFTFRKIYPICLENNLRVIAPDLPGFGKSDKPASGEDYTLSALVDRMALFFDQPAFHPCFLFAHDWGVVIGLILAVRHPDLFSGIIACNSFLPAPGFSLSPMLLLWQKVARYSPILPVGRIVDFATKRKLSRQERAGYDFPFTHEREKLAIRMLPQLITRNWSDPGVSMIEECRKKLGLLEMPFLTLFSKEDPLTRGGDKQLQAQIPGSRGQPHCLLNGKHFLQEDAPTELGLMISNFILQNR